jgi:sulfopyruvate decarboxylase subunit alpha
VSCAIALDALLRAGVETVVALPDSKLSPLCAHLMQSDQVTYIQATHEATAVGIAAGLTLCGVKSLVVMENSGLRTACETLARFNLSHGLYCCFLISHRGAFGERNWWGFGHHETMFPILRMLRIRWSHVRSLAELPSRIGDAYEMLAAGQCSVALIAESSLIEDLRR